MSNLIYLSGDKCFAPCGDRTHKIRLLRRSVFPVKLTEHINWKLSPKRGSPTPIDCGLFSLVAALFYQRSASGRCFLMTTHAFSSSKAQDPKNKPRINSWWTRRDSNALPPACKAGALPAELLAQISHF